MKKKNKIGKLARKLEIIGDTNRLRIMCVIFENRKICVSKIARKLKLSVAVASHHLNVLAKEGILQSSRDGKMICYHLKKESFISELKNLICKYK